MNEILLSAAIKAHSQLSIALHDIALRDSVPDTIAAERAMLAESIYMLTINHAPEHVEAIVQGALADARKMAEKDQ